MKKPLWCSAWKWRYHPQSSLLKVSLTGISHRYPSKVLKVSLKSISQGICGYVSKNTFFGFICTHESFPDTVRVFTMTECPHYHESATMRVLHQFVFWICPKWMRKCVLETSTPHPTHMNPSTYFHEEARVLVQGWVPAQVWWPLFLLCLRRSCPSDFAGGQNLSNFLINSKLHV